MKKHLFTIMKTKNNNQLKKAVVEDNTMFGEITSNALQQFLLERANNDLTADTCVDQKNDHNTNNLLYDGSIKDTSDTVMNNDEENNDSFQNYWDDENDYIDDNAYLGGFKVGNIDNFDIIGLNNEPDVSSLVLKRVMRKSCLSLLIPSHSIVNLSRHLTNLSIHAKLEVKDDREKLIKGQSVTKGSFARNMNQWFQSNNITKSARNDLMNLLYNSFGSAVHLPIRLLDLTEKNKRLSASVFQYGKRMKSLEIVLNDEKKPLLDSEENGFGDDEKSLDNNDDESSDENTEMSDNFIRNFHHNEFKLRHGCVDKSDESETNSLASSKDIESVSTNVLNDCNAESIVEKYDMRTARFIQIDQCYNDCFVYAGDNMKLFSCPSCNEVRFRPCCRAMCRGRGSSLCEHLRNVDGVAYKQMFYRPLLILIADLLKTPFFLKALNYRRNPHVHPTTNNCYSDFMDGYIATFHLESMKNIYLEWQLKHPEERREAVCVTLLLSEFYDGGQLFKSKVTNFWALMTQILNLPPTYRGKLGIGMFVQAIYAGKHKTAERFLFIDNFCEELNLLYNGVEINISGVSYFIQARLVLHTLDTRAAEAVLSLQSTSGSRAGCPFCQGVCGVHDGNKCVYIGHRHLLPSHHYLRFLGQSGTCCPKDFYHPTKPTLQLRIDEVFVSNSESFSIEENACLEQFYKLVAAEEKRQKKDDQPKKRKRTDATIELTSRKLVWNKGFSEKNNFEFCTPCDAEDDAERIQDMKQFLFLGGEYQWSHQEKEYDFQGNSITSKEKGLRKYLFYRHFDLRKFNPHKRVTYEQHLNDAMTARTLNSTGRKSKTLKHCNGIQDVWCFDRLQYADIPKQVPWPFVHAITGIVKLLSGIIVGVLPESAATKKPGAKRRFQKKSTLQEEQKLQRELERLRAAAIEQEENEEGYDAGVDAGVDESAKTLNKKEKNTIFNSYRPTHTGEEKAPYEASKNDIDRCREWLQCVLLPPALDDDSYNMKGFLSPGDGKLGYMKMNQRLKLISSFWEVVILSMKDLADQYKLFYRIIAKDISKLLAFNFSKDSISQIHADIIESICLWEGLLPAKNCTFQLHELIDMAEFIPLFGPPMGVSEFPGERAIGKMISRKLKSNTGGVSFEKLMMHNQIDFELRTIKTFYKKAVVSFKTGGKRSPNSDLHCKFDSQTGILLFNSVPFSIYKPELMDANAKPYINLSGYEMDSLVDALVLEVQKQFDFDIDLCEQNSSLYRIESLRLKFKEKLSCFEWLSYISENPIDDLTTEDYEVALKLLSFEPKYFQHAHVYGVLFASRGSWLRETKLPKSARYGDQNKQLIETSDKGSLSESWNNSKSYSSWCRFEQHGRKHSYGQINSFFRIDIEDPSVDGLVLASVTCRKFNTVQKSSVHCIRGKGSLDIDTLFVATTDIYPTRIATIPFNTENQAISVERQNLHNEYVTSDTSGFDYFYMITLHPEKLSIRPEKRPYKKLQI